MILINGNWEQVAGIISITDIISEYYNSDFAYDVKNIYYNRGEKFPYKVSIDDCCNYIYKLEDLIDIIAEKINYEFAKEVEKVFERYWYSSTYENKTEIKVEQKNEEISNIGGLNKVNAIMDFAQGHYFDVINTIKEQSLTDFKTIVLASKSHLAVGNFVSAYLILETYFETNEPIYQLPYADKAESFPLGYDMFQLLKVFEIDIWKEELYKNKLFPINTNGTNVIDRNQEAFSENCYAYITNVASRINTITIQECVAGLVKCEVRMELSRKDHNKTYWLKSLYLNNRLFLFTNSIRLL